MPLRRRIADLVALAFAGAATAFGLTWLIWILWTTFAQGAAALSPALVTQMTPPPGESGGLLNAFYGSAVMVFLALLIGCSLGLFAQDSSTAPNSPPSKAGDSSASSQKTSKLPNPNLAPPRSDRISADRLPPA